MKLNKALIAQRFAKAGHSYSDHAVVQKYISQQLIEKMQQQGIQLLPQVLEIGCGSGNLTQLLLHYIQVNHLYLNDLYEEVQQHFNVQIPTDWYIGDIEQLTLPQPLDAIVSCSALQWMLDLPHLLQRFHVALKVQGWFCFSSFGPDNFKEIKALTGQGLEYWSIDEWQKQLELAGFETIELTQQDIVMPFESAKAVLKHLKATGVTGTGQQRWTKQRLTDFYQDYQVLQLENGQYPLTYQPIYGLARRKV